MNFIKSQNALVNAIMFPGGMTASSYTPETFASSYNLKLLFIPFKPSCCNSFSYLYSAPTHIPVLLAVNNNPKTNLFCIHFHGNACDIGQVAICAQREAQAFRAHYMLVEYPGYGISNGYPNEVVIDEVSRTVHAFVENQLQVHFSKIVLIGRSIGTGPTCALASYLQSIGKPPAAVIIQSPFATIRDTAADLLGSITICMLNRWENWRYLLGNYQHVIKSPVLFIHADRDKIINCNHSIIMHEHRTKQGLPSELFIQQTNERIVKGHNFFDYELDVVVPSKEFLKRVVVSTEIIEKPLLLPPEVLQVHSLIPEEFTFGISTGANVSADKYILSPEGDSGSNSNSKLTKLVYLSWSCCPCVFCLEGLVASSLFCVKETLFCMGCCQPEFDFQRLKPKDESKASCWNLFYPRSAAQKIVEEETVKTEVRNPLNNSNEQQSTSNSRRRSKSANININDVPNHSGKNNNVTIIDPAAYSESQTDKEGHLDYIPG